MLGDPLRPPMERLRDLVHAFVRSECEEAAFRGALDDGAPLYRHAPEARQARAAGDPVIRAFMAEALPDAPEALRERAGDFIMTTMSTVGTIFSKVPQTLEEIALFADALADMLCAYLENLSRRT